MSDLILEVTNDLVEKCRKKSKEAWKQAELGKFTYWIGRGARYAIMQSKYAKEQRQRNCDEGISKNYLGG